MTLVNQKVIFIFGERINCFLRLAEKGFKSGKYIQTLFVSQFVLTGLDNPRNWGGKWVRAKTFHFPANIDFLLYFKL